MTFYNANIVLICVPYQLGH